jgi:hypothetical protein
LLLEVLLEALKKEKLVGRSAGGRATKPAARKTVSP